MDNPRVRFDGQRPAMIDLLAPATPNRELMRLVLSNPTQALLRDLAPSIGDIEATIIAAKAATTPMCELAAAERAEALAKVRDSLKILGVKVLPLASEDQARAWLVAVSVSLDDLPLQFVLRAARDALHQVFRFPNEVEAAVREGAEIMVDTYRRATTLLHQMKDELERAAAPRTPLIEHIPQYEPGRPWTVERVKQTPRYIVECGLAGGFIAQEIVDEAFPTGMVEDVSEAAAARNP